MARTRFSARAEDDLVGIALYSAKTWGSEQARRYVLDMESFCQTLAELPRIGRSYTAKHKTWFRMEHGSHVVYYRKVSGGIVIQRILHKKTQPEFYLPL